MGRAGSIMCRRSLETGPSEPSGVRPACLTSLHTPDSSCYIKRKTANSGRNTSSQKPLPHPPLRFPLLGRRISRLAQRLSPIRPRSHPLLLFSLRNQYLNPRHPRKENLVLLRPRRLRNRHLKYQLPESQPPPSPKPRARQSYLRMCLFLPLLAARSIPLPLCSVPPAMTLRCLRRHLVYISYYPRQQKSPRYFPRPPPRAPTSLSQPNLSNRPESPPRLWLRN